MTIAHRILSNTLWQIIGKVVTAVLGIISVKLITNYLARTEYGQYTIIYDYTALFAIIADFGFFTIAVREMTHAADKRVIEKIVGNVLAIRTVLAIAALGIGTAAAFVIPAYRGSQIPLGVAIVAAATVITLIAGTISSVLQFYLRMRWASIALTAGKIITVAYIAAIIFYIYPHAPASGFHHLQLAWIFGALVTVAITLAASVRIIPIRFRFDIVFWKEIGIKALPYGAALILGTVYFRMGTITLSFFKMEDDAGYLGVPLRFLEILQIIPHYFMNSVLPLLTMRASQGKPAAAVRYSLNSLIAIGLPILAGGIILAFPITAAVSSPEFLSHRLADGSFSAGSDIALKILLVAMILTYIHVVFTYVLVAMGRQIELLWINGAAAALSITLNLLLAPRLGFIGAAVAAVCTEFIMFVLLLWRVRRRVDGFLDLRFILKSIFSAAVMGFALYVATINFNSLLLPKGLVVLIPLGAIIYAAVMLITGAVTKEMLALLKKGEPTPQDQNPVQNF